jgi:hypothetical protein
VLLCACVQQVAGRGSIETVQVKGADSEDWQSLNNLWGAAWETGTVPKPPLDFRVQDDTGVEVRPSHTCRTFPACPKC